MADPRFKGAEDKRIPTDSKGFYMLENVGHLSGGTSTSDYVTSYNTAEKFLNFYFQAAAASGSARGMYMRLNFATAGSQAGEAVRAYTTVSAALTGGNTTAGIHASLALTAAGSQAGLGVGLRATLDAAAATRTLTGTYAALQVDSNFGAGNTVDGQKVSFIRVADVGAVQMPYLFDFSSLTAADSAAAIQADSGAVSTIYGYARVLCPGGAVGYIAIYAAHA